MKNFLKLFAVFTLCLLFVQSVSFAHNAPPDNAPTVVYVYEPAVCFAPIAEAPKLISKQVSGSATLFISQALPTSKRKAISRYWYGLSK